MIALTDSIQLMLAITIPAILLAIIFWIAFHCQVKTWRAWDAFAKSCNLEHETPFNLLFTYLKVRGVYRNYPIVVDSDVRGSGKSQAAYTRVMVTLNQPCDPLAMAISEEGIISSIAKMAGAQDIQVGIANIDKRFMIKGAPNALVVMLLKDKGIGERLLSLRKVYLRIEHQEVYFEQRNFIDDAEYLKLVVDAVIDTAEATDQLH